MTVGSNYLEPIETFNDAELLAGAKPELLPEGTEIINDLNVAMDLENSQDPPEGYRIWSDALANAVSPFFSDMKAREGEEIIDEKANEVWSSLGEFERELNKKRIKKTITEREEFWLTVSYDILETLKSIAVARYVGADSAFFENVYKVFRAGFYPCGIKNDGALVAFDPKSLKG